jgi:two-component system cell cycle sensor histidine kinase/response regulator CckA
LTPSLAAAEDERMASLPLGSPHPSRLPWIILVAATILSVAVLGWTVGDVAFVGGFVAAIAVLSATAFLVLRNSRGAAAHASEAKIDWTIVGVAADLKTALAVTDRSGALVYANGHYDAQFGALQDPAKIDFTPDGRARLVDAIRSARQDGTAEALGLPWGDGSIDVRIARAGLGEDHLLWRFERPAAALAADTVRAMIEGLPGQRLGEVGIMAALVDAGGRLITANLVFVRRAFGRVDAVVEGQDFVRLLRSGADAQIRFASEPDETDPLRLLQVPLDRQMAGAAVFLLLDEDGSGSSPAGRRGTAEVHLHALLAMLPLGLALADRDGRFLFMNEAFDRGAALPAGERPVYPSDLVVKEDKGIVADAVRRFALGSLVSGDLAVRLKHRPEEPVALTIAGARGLGDAAVLLSLKDNTEESRLKKQVAQATKMQAVGQLAGGVAHDFNNILTAIIGHCDLMLMRHAPGDSDFDDIQQIRSNSNRAAALTRQLLAFSRQQTLRPQVLQLPDVISEVSILLKRLLSETVTLVVKHGRGLGPVRADPGQLEQVIVNLAVNARDAMPGGGTLTLQTYAVSAAEVAGLGSEILPTADYTALGVTDTGSGIRPEDLGKVFEPFFTTKEVGKGTGLGLSTVYGIVKQTGGFIFADSVVGQGTTFTIYLPVHRPTEPALPEPVEPRRLKAPELWGSGTILLVEDEDMVRAVAERALSRQGYKVLTAANGEEALELLDGHGVVDLLISDVVMPMMDGPTMVRHARERFPGMPVLFMSGYAEEQLRRSIDLDHVAFLPKPFSVQQLAEAARSTIQIKSADSA